MVSRLLINHLAPKNRIGSYQTMISDWSIYEACSARIRGIWNNISYGRKDSSPHQMHRNYTRVDAHLFCASFLWTRNLIRPNIQKVHSWWANGYRNISIDCIRLEATCWSWISAQRYQVLKHICDQILWSSLSIYIYCSISRLWFMQ